ncbi:threo-3-hydroxy-L-aspartate ammonia-lyase [Desulfovibrio sp. OttesenSCG-928-I05]|nr:threo-3-hydroxy-L-aspartate ammonia-lyase [Desulfovibrio sp. OttesenSCG-928-I05]
MTALAISFDDVKKAQERIAPAAHRTPVLTSTTADELTGAKLFFKCENFQRMGAFKFRGGYNSLAQLTPEQKKNGVVAFSSGNHAQAVALSAKILGMPAVIIMPQDAPAAKVAATRGYGAEVVTYDRYSEDREVISRKLAEERGLTLIPPYDHAHVMAGQGTAVLELIEDAGPMDLVLTPLGGGGLLSGCAVAAKALAPSCRVYGVEPEAGNDGQRSFRTGSIVKIDTPKTIADGAQTQFLGKLTFPIIQETVTDILTATDAELIQTMRFFAERMKMVVEPTGCLAAAAVFNKRVDIAGKRVGIVLSGGNMDIAQFGSFLSTGI